MGIGKSGGEFENLEENLEEMKKYKPHGSHWKKPIQTSVAPQTCCSAIVIEPQRAFLENATIQGYSFTCDQYLHLCWVCICIWIWACIWICVFCFVFPSSSHSRKNREIWGHSIILSKIRKFCPLYMKFVGETVLTYFWWDLSKGLHLFFALILRNFGRFIRKL